MEAGGAAKAAVVDGARCGGGFAMTKATEANGSRARRIAVKGRRTVGFIIVMPF